MFLLSLYSLACGNVKVPVVRSCRVAKSKEFYSIFCWFFGVYSLNITRPLDLIIRSSMEIFCPGWKKVWQAVLICSTKKKKKNLMQPVTFLFCFMVYDVKKYHQCHKTTSTGYHCSSPIATERSRCFPVVFHIW